MSRCDGLSNRTEKGLRLVVMQAVARLRASGIPVLRRHTDRAKEYSSTLLLEWMASQNIHATKSGFEDHAANGRAEVAVRELKRSARKCLLASGTSSKFWPLAIRRASEQSWRQALSLLGAPERPLLAFGTYVQARNREWKQRDNKHWGPRTVPGRLMGPAPQTLSAYTVLLDDGSLYVSSSVHPVPSRDPPKPRHRHASKAPLGSVRAFLVPAGGESFGSFGELINEGTLGFDEKQGF